MICSYSFFLGMTAFFYAGSKVTKYKASLKHNIEDDYKEGRDNQKQFDQVELESKFVCFLPLYLSRRK